MNAKLTPVQYNLLICFVYLLLSMFTMQVLNTLSVWPPAGVALAGVMIFGRKAWLGIASGTFLAVLYHFHLLDLDPFSIQHLVINIATTFGNTVAAITAYNIIKKQLAQEILLTKITHAAMMFMLASIAIGFISAFFGVGIYYVLGLEWFDGLYLGTLNWGISNTLSAVVISPALYFLWRGWPHHSTPASCLQVLLIAIIVVMISYLIFGPNYDQHSLPILQPALLLFPLLYSALKFSPTSTSCLIMLSFFLGWIGSNQGWGYFYQHHPQTAEITMQFFFLFMLSAVLLVQAVFIQRKKEQLQLTQILEEKVKARTIELEQAKQAALTLSVTDSLTELYNRRGFFQAVNQQFKQYLRYPGSCALLLLDLDNFKSVNDKHGHAIGDEVIRVTASILSRHSRDADISGRIGGEEFVLFLPMTNAEEALTLAERIRDDIEQQDISDSEQRVQFTVSIGVSALREEDNEVEALLQRADIALYQAKHQGRNQSQCDELVPTDAKCLMSVSQKKS